MGGCLISFPFKHKNCELYLEAGHKGCALSNKSVLGSIICVTTQMNKSFPAFEKRVEKQVARFAQLSKETKPFYQALVHIHTQA